jgi:hypothetical protein
MREEGDDSSSKYSNASVMVILSKMFSQHVPEIQKMKEAYLVPTACILSAAAAHAGMEYGKAKISEMVDNYVKTQDSVFAKTMLTV